MQIGGLGGAASPWANALRIRGAGGAASSVAAPVAGPRLSLRDFATHVSELGDALRDLRLAGRFRETGGRGREARAVSAAPLGLGTTPTAAVLRSSEEVNTVATSYGPTAPSWAGGSSAAPSISGEYDGSNGDTRLTFTATAGGVLDDEPIELEVTDGEGQVVDTVSIGVGQGSGVFTLANGLEVSFGGGTIDTGDSFELDVYATIGASVDPDAAFDGSGPNGPNFEPGVSVTSGAFFINGQRITVDAADSIQSVVDTINGSAAGVTAAWDVDAERLVLTQNTPGLLERIDIVGDSSGFVEALKLDDAELEFGSSNESQQQFDRVGALSGVDSGTFTINGEEFQLEIGADSLASTIRWINASDAGVLANYDEASGLFSIQAIGRRSLVLDDGTTNLFSALGIEPGVYRGDASGREVRFDDERALRRELTDLSRSLAQVFEGTVGGYASGAAKVIRDSLVDELEGTFDSLLEKDGAERLRSGIGIDLGERRNEARTLVVDSAQLGRALRRDEDALADLLFSEEKEDGQSGLLERLEGALERAFGQLEGMLAPEEAIGLRLDVSG